MLSQNVTHLSTLRSSSKNQVINGCQLRMSNHIGSTNLELIAILADHVISYHNVLSHVELSKQELTPDVVV